MIARPSPQAVLAGCTVVLTRPAHQVEPLKSEIETLGATVISFPTLNIKPVTDDHTRRRFRSFVGADMAVFVSANAVWHGVPLVDDLSSWPQGTRIAAVGRATADALAELGHDATLVPETGDGALALLSLPAFGHSAIRGLHVFVFKGRGGLSALAETLSERGATVTQLEVYERRRPDVDPGPLLARAREGSLDIIVVTSGEALGNLFEMVGEAGRSLIADVSMLVVSQRIAELARSLGVSRAPTVAAGAGRSEILDALKLWKESEHDERQRAH